MNCFHPNIIILKPNYITKKDGTPGYGTQIIKYGSIHYEYIFQEIKENKKSNFLFNGEKVKIILAPCGMCQGCKTNRRREWTTRLELESKYYQNNLFVTLTYNDENIIIPKYWAKSDTGEIIKNPGWWTGTLSKEHAKRFIRSFKEYCRVKHNHTGIKYYLAGEYGSSKEGTRRPHYHIILLNLPELPLKPIARSPRGETYFENEKIAKIWNKGFVTIGKVTHESIQYVAGYVNKKMYGKKALEDYDLAGKIPEFALMSEGIGKKYYEEHKEEIYKYDEVINGKGQSVKPPKYFDRLYKEENPEHLKEIQEKRENISAYETEKKLKINDKNYKEILLTEEEIAEDKQAIYSRNRIK